MAHRIPPLDVVEITDLPSGERSFHHLSGRPCLDLVATVGERWRRRFERLLEPGDLDRWLDELGLPAGGATAGELEAARTLRRAIEVLVAEVIDGDGLDPVAVAEINALAAGPSVRPAIVDGARRWRVPPEATASAAGLAHVAADAIDLFTSPLRDRIRECAAPDCALVYVDTSRAGARQWCSMRACGNRAKVARHRALG